MRSSTIKGQDSSKTQGLDSASNQAFVETIVAFSKNLESEKISIDLQNMFLKYSE